MNSHTSLFALVAALSAICGISALSLWTSRLNQFFFFGRTLPREVLSLPAASELTRKYVRRILIGLGAALILFAALRVLGGLPTLVCLVLVGVLQQVIFYRAFALAHREAGIAISGVRSGGSDAEQRIVSVALLGAKTSASSRLTLMLLPLATVAVTWAAVMAVSHLSFSALADAAGQGGGSGLMGFGAGVLAAGTLFSLLVRYSARYRTPMAQCLLRNMLHLEWIAVAALAVAVIAVPLHFVIERAVMRIVMLPVLAVVIGWVIYARARVQCAPPAVEQNGDEHWRWGLFYSNAADPALFIQARTGLGYTLNFGRVLAWPLAAAVFGYIVFLMLLGFHRI